MLLCRAVFSLSRCSSHLVSFPFFKVRCIVNSSRLLESLLNSEEVRWNDDSTIASLPPESQLTNFSTNDLITSVRRRSTTDVLPMVSALINMNKLDAAETCLAVLGKEQLEVWKFLKDSGVPNLLIKSYMDRKDEAKIEKWRIWLFSRKICSPDAMTYALFLQFYFANLSEAKFTKVLKKLNEEMLIDGVDLNGILQINYLGEELVAKLVKMNAIQSNDLPNELDRVSIENLNLNISNLTKAKGNNSSHLPEVKSIESKADSITYLKDSLKILSTNPTIDLYSLQEKLERDCYQSMAQKIQHEMESYKSATKNSILCGPLKHQMAIWQKDLVRCLKLSFKEATTLHETSPRQIGLGSGTLYSSILASIEVEKIALICLQELTRSSSYNIGDRSQVMVRLALSIGQALEREVFASQITKRQFLVHTKLNPKFLSRIFNDRSLFDATMRKQYAALERNIDALKAGWIPKWSTRLKAEIGTYVVSVAITNLKFTTSTETIAVPFAHKIVQMSHQSTGVVEVHPEVFQMIKAESATVFIDPWAMPMLVPPRPWLTYKSGGYLTHSSSCVRFKDDPLHEALIRQDDKEGKLDKILLGLDVLGRTPWKINDNVLNIALKMWNCGINVSTLERSADIDLLEFKSRDSFTDQKEFLNYVREAFSRKEAKNKAHSTMCDTNYKLEIARQFSGLTFYLPHSVDFRGRAYPIPPHLSHVGSDLSRGLLMFSEGKPLGERGLRWLKIQLANMAGFDKASLDDRVKFAEEHLEDIYDCADNPIEGRQWWTKAEEPWQCLAVCFELASALRSPNPTEYISHVPCQQDGSCNGLQHYAALGCDVDGAIQVNLAPSDKPQDVYSAVARLVSTHVEEDSKLDSNHIANLLKGKISRKLVKQTVMTNVYGVTKFGARQQIESRLKEMEIVPPEQYNEARSYVADLVFKSLGTLFDSAQKIQKWLNETAIEIGKSVPLDVAKKFGSSIPEDAEDENSNRSRVWNEMHGDPSERYPQTSLFWTTPLGFRVLQPYLKPRTISLKTVLQSLSLKAYSKFDPVDVAKQASAFPPNFVHSLDATHMFMTALSCYNSKLTFASVHDCFWTHASTVDEMNKILREQFVKLHSQPILENLREEFIEKYRGYVVPEVKIPGGNIRHIQVTSWRPINIPPLPPKGSFDINLVLDSPYFFS